MTAGRRHPHLPQALLQTIVSFGRDSVPGVPVGVPRSMLTHARLGASSNTSRPAHSCRHRISGSLGLGLLQQLAHIGAAVLANDTAGATAARHYQPLPRAHTGPSTWPLWRARHRGHCCSHTHAPASSFACSSNRCCLHNSPGSGSWSRGCSIACPVSAHTSADIHGFHQVIQEPAPTSTAFAGCRDTVV